MDQNFAGLLKISENLRFFLKYQIFPKIMQLSYNSEKFCKIANIPAFIKSFNVFKNSKKILTFAMKN